LLHELLHYLVQQNQMVSPSTHELSLRVLQLSNDDGGKPSSSDHHRNASTGLPLQMAPLETAAAPLPKPAQAPNRKRRWSRCNSFEALLRLLALCWVCVFGIVFIAGLVVGSGMAAWHFCFEVILEPMNEQILPDWQRFLWHAARLALPVGQILFGLQLLTAGWLLKWLVIGRYRNSFNILWV